MEPFEYIPTEVGVPTEVGNLFSYPMCVTSESMEITDTFNRLKKYDLCRNERK